MKKIVFLISCCLVLGLTFGSLAGASSPYTNNGGHHDHDKEWTAADKEKIEELIKLGYEKPDIFHALKLSKLSNTKAEEILAYYKENKSWKDTAEHFGVDPTKIKQHHHWKKYNKYLESNKDKVIPYLANYLNKEEAELNSYLNDGAKLHTIVKASILSKLAGVEIKDILIKKNNGQSFRDIALDLKVNKQDMFKEMKKLKEAIDE